VNLAILTKTLHYPTTLGEFLALLQTLLWIKTYLLQLLRILKPLLGVHQKLLPAGAVLIQLRIIKLGGQVLIRQRVGAQVQIPKLKIRILHGVVAIITLITDLHLIETVEIETSVAEIEAAAEVEAIVAEAEVVEADLTEMTAEMTTVVSNHLKMLVGAPPILTKAQAGILESRAMIKEAHGVSLLIK
jgi:hypothetical protein